MQEDNPFNYEYNDAQMLEIGQNIKEIRLKNGMSQEAFAERIGVSRQTVINWEKGKSVPSVEKIGVIISQCSTSFEEIFDKECAPENVTTKDLCEEENNGVVTSDTNRQKITLKKISIISCFSLIACIVLFALALICREVISFFTSDSYSVSLKISMSDMMIYIVAGLVLLITLILLLLVIIKKINFRRLKK